MLEYGLAAQPGQSGAGRRTHPGIDILQGLQQHVAVFGIAALGQTTDRFAPYRNRMTRIGERSPCCRRDGELQLTSGPQTGPPSVRFRAGLFPQMPFVGLSPTVRRPLQRGLHPCR